MTGMVFLWPEMLVLLALVPLFVAAYLWILGRRRKAALRYASLTLVKDAMAGSAWRRHVPPALFLAALTAMLVAVARPAAVMTLPSQHGTVILAMDVSGSMGAADVEPSRLEAAQAAARAFIDEQPRTTRIGIVSFGGGAMLVQPPTNSREDLRNAIGRLHLQRGTAIGSGIIVSLATIFPDAGIDISELTYGGRDFRRAQRNQPLQGRKGDAQKAFKPVPPGSHSSAVIVLLSDGQTTTGPDPLEAARMAADRGVKIFTVGIGTVSGTTLGFGGWSMRVRLDEDALKEVARITRGEYFYAGNAADLKKIYQSLNSRLVMEKKEAEITALFSAAGALLAIAAGFLSLAWFNRIL